MGAYDELFGSGEKKKPSAYDDLFGGSPDLEPPPTDMDFSASPMEVPKDNSLTGILDQLLHGNAQRDQEKRESALAAQGVKYERPDVAGAYMGLMSPLGAAGKGIGGVAKSAGNEVIMGAAQAALDEFQSGTSPEELLGALLKGGGISGAADVALSGAGALAGKAGGVLTGLGAKARNVVAGGTKKEAEAILERFDGDPAKVDEMLGGLLEKYSPSPWYGRGSGGHLEQVQKQLPGARQEHSDVLAQASEEGVDEYIPAAWANVQGRMAEEAAARGSRAVGDQARQEAAAFQRVADDLGGLEAPSSVQQFVSDKSALQAAASGQQAMRSIGDAASDQAAGFGGRVLRDELEHSVMGAAEPETLEAFIGSRDKVRDLSMLEELLKGKTAGEQSGGDFGNALGGAIAGSALGAGASVLTPGEDTSALGIGGLLGGLATGTRSGLRQAMGSWGSDVGANILKAGGAAARGVGSALDKAPTGALTAQALDASNDKSRGHNAVSAVENALKTNPQQLGPYAERLANAEDKRVEITVLLDEDPRFRALMRKLSAGVR